jgi:hypothetical protein
MSPWLQNAQVCGLGRGRMHGERPAESDRDRAPTGRKLRKPPPLESAGAGHAGASWYGLGSSKWRRNCYHWQLWCAYQN